MKAVTFLGVFLISLELIGQNSDWIQQSPPVTINNLQDVEVLSPGVLVAVGADGTIIKSEDGGETWSRKISTTYNHLNAVDFVTPSIGFACGNSGTILKTSDGGESWSAQASNTWSTLYSIDFISPDNGWVSGYNRTILKTTNGGNTWISQYSTSVLTFLEEVKVVDQQKVFIAGWGSGGDFYKTTDSGMNWNGSDLGGWAKGIDFINDTTGWIAGITATYISVTESWGDIYTTINGKKATIWKTTNSGNSWTPFIFNPEQWLYDITVFNQNTVFAVGEKGLIFYTKNGGQNWTQTSDPKFSSTSFNAVTFESTNIGYIVGDKGTILKTVDGGVTWVQKGNNGTTNYLRSLFFVTDSVGWVVGEKGTILKTSNGGKNWVAQTSGVANMLYSVFFVDTLAGWCAGSSGIILSTTNGGTTWSTQNSGVAEDLYSIDFNDKNIGWIAGSSGRIIHTINGGATWESQTSSTTASLYALFFINGTTGWAVGSNGKVVKTTNGGLLWTETKIKTSDFYDQINDIVFINENTGWCIGDWILKTTDGGQTWVKQFGDMSEYYDYNNLNSICFIDSQTGWISASHGKVLKTTNGGSTWGIASTGNTESYYDISYKNQLTGWVAGYGGYIMKTTTGGGSFTPMEYLGIPKLLEPTDGKWYVSGNPKLKWNSVGFGSRYELLVTTNGVYQYDSTVVNISNISDTLFSTGWLQPNTDYNWKVRVLGNNGIKGNWSTKFRFKTSDVSTVVPTLYNPYGNEDSEMYRMNLTWYCYNGESYRVQVSTDSTFNTSLTIDSVVYSMNMKALLEYGQTYYWRVKQIWGDLPLGWSNVGTFSTPQKIAFINILKPQIFETVLKGMVYTITWNDNITGGLKLSLYNNYSKVFDIGVTTGKSFEWLVPLTLPDNEKYQVVISDSVLGYSQYSSFFSIANPSITFYSPQSGSEWVIGSKNCLVSWYDNLPDNLIIILYKGVTLKDTIGNTENGSQYSFNWNIPVSLIPGTDYRIMLKDTISNFYKYSDYFSIVVPNIQVLNPDSNNVFIRGSSEVIIMWNDNITANLLVLLYKAEKLIDTIGYTDNQYTGFILWNVSFNLTSGDDYKVVIKDPISGIFGTSNNFSIVDPFVSILTPLPGVIWRRGSTGNLLTWEDNIDRTMMILLYKGQTLFDTLAFTENRFSHLFLLDISATIPTGTDYRIAVKDTTNNTIGFSPYITITWATSIEEIDENIPFVWIYPNPAYDRLYIEVKNPQSRICRVFLYNLSGQKLIERNFDGTLTELDIKSVNPGIYFIRTEVGDKMYSKQIVIQ
jgi:photosystem II stability/assembly factor-like uncharacterized protein